MHRSQHTGSQQQQQQVKCEMPWLIGMKLLPVTRWNMTFVTHG